MKRIFATALACVMALTLLTSCGGGKDKPAASTPSQDPSFGADLTAFYNDIMNAAEEGPMMMDLAADAEMLEAMYPGLGAVETKQLVVASPAMSAVAIEFAFAEVANAADVETVKTIFQTRIDNQVAGGAWYPETIEGWQNNSEIVVIDNYVCLFVCPEKDGMIEAFRNGTEIPAWAKAQEPAEDEFQGEAEGGIMDMPVEDGPAAYDPEAETPAAEPEAPAVAPETPAVAAIDLGAFYWELYSVLYPMDAEGYPTGPAVDNFALAPEILDGYYPGLTAIETKQCYVFMPMMSGVPYEVALIEAANTDDAEAIKTILQNRIDTEKNNQMAYPMVIENWELNSRIVTNGNYILMAVTADFDAYINAFNALF